MPHRYFTRELAEGRAALTGSDAHHLADVMRARIGEEVVLCGPDGLEYLGTVTAIEPGRVEFSVTDGTTSKAEPDCAVTLFAGYPKAGKLEEVIRHSVELGVTEVVPFFSRSGVLKSCSYTVSCHSCPSVQLSTPSPPGVR